jgi:flavin reductase (DIM6/NTAB) family NADH-FMN oxidoreductase RutF
MREDTGTMTTDRLFRRALGEFATGVAVITAKGSDGSLIGMTMSSFNSVSVDPPLVLFSVARSAYSLAAMLDAKGYAVSVLARDQEHISNSFAKALSAKWQNVSSTVGHAEAPLISGALAHFECTPYASYDGGDHVIFVGKVVRFSSHPDQPAPLVFFRGRYHDIQTDQQRAPEWPLPIHY